MVYVKLISVATKLQISFVQKIKLSKKRRKNLYDLFNKLITYYISKIRKEIEVKQVEFIGISKKINTNQFKVVNINKSKNHKRRNIITRWQNFPKKRQYIKDKPQVSYCLKVKL